MGPVDTSLITLYLLCLVCVTVSSFDDKHHLFFIEPLTVLEYTKYSCLLLKNSECESHLYRVDVI